MAKPKKEKKPKEDGGIKTKSLWDHMKHIYEVQDPNYYVNLSESDKKSFSVYMVNRFLSMNSDWIENIDYLQRFLSIDAGLYYRLVISIIPKGKYYFPYIKSVSDSSKYTTSLIKLFSDHFEVSSREARVYLDIINMYPDGRNQVLKICKLYGLEEATVKEMCEY